MPHPIPPEETRSIDQLQEQFDVERELAQRLRDAPDRRGMYSAVYDEFLRRVPHHPALAQKNDTEAQSPLLLLQLRLLRPFLAARPRFLEVGGGDCALTIELSRSLPRVFAIEAGSEIVEGLEGAAKVEIIVADSPPDVFRKSLIIKEGDMLLPGQADHYPEIIFLSQIQKPRRRHAVNADCVYAIERHVQKIPIDSARIGKLVSGSVGSKRAVSNAANVEFLVADG